MPPKAKQIVESEKPLTLRYDEIVDDKAELYHLLDEGRAAAQSGRARPYGEAFDEIERKIISGQL
ncbi:MAG: hypothetical protein LBS19_12015 [Clostridiales bacterium]|jgi:hypothetical protein|nr:hypothetical protein [Clostridiales bacterium]